MRFKKVLFVDLFESFYDRHPIYALSAICKEHQVEVDYVFSKNSKKIFSYVQETKPDMLMYSAFSVHVPLFIEFDKLIKSVFPDIYTIIGGPGVNDKASHADIKNSTITAACVGEGDIALRDFFNNNGECSHNFIIAQNLINPTGFNKYAELDTLPFPDREPVYKKDTLRAAMPSKQFMGSRGCPYKCTYCHNHLEHDLFKGCGKHVRLKSVDYFIEEILQVKKKYPLKTAVFQDDIFFVNKKWGMEFCEKFPRQVGIPFSCNVRSNLIDDDVARALKEGGCTTVAWAIESGDADIRNRVLQRNMSDAGILQAAEHFNKYNIMHRVNNVIGIPGESFDQMLKTLDLNIKSKSYLSSAHIFIPFQGLKLTEYAIQNNFLDKNGIQTLPNTFADETVLNFKQEDKVKIKRLVYLFPLLTRFPYFYHNKKFFNLLIKTPNLLLSLVYQPIHLFYWSKMYRVSTGLKTKIRLFLRYRSYGA